MSAALEDEPELEFPEPGPLPPPVTEFTEKTVSSSGVATRGIGVRGRRYPGDIGNGCDGPCVAGLPEGNRTNTTALPPRFFPTTTIDPEATTTTIDPSDTTIPTASSTTQPAPSSTVAPTTTSTP